MAKEKKILTEEEKQNIKDRLEERFGSQGEDWDVAFVIIRGVEKAYAVISPGKKVFNLFRDRQNNPKFKESQLEYELTLDCLVQDFEGTCSIKEFNQDNEIKPVLQSVLGSKIVHLAASGFETSKKD
jgi:hypothetical protein